jgi:hypothetical protein
MRASVSSTVFRGEAEARKDLHLAVCVVQELDGGLKQLTIKPRYVDLWGFDLRREWLGYALV